MKKITTGLTLLLTLTISAPAVQASKSSIKAFSDDYPVMIDDSLWGISTVAYGQWLHWPVNRHTSEPQPLGSNDVISPAYADGNAPLQVHRHPEKKLSPTIRSSRSEDAITALPFDNFLSKTRLIGNAEFSAAPYVLDGIDHRQLIGMGDDFYALGNFANYQLSYDVYRRGDPYIEPFTGEVLGLRGEYVGSARIKAVTDNIATLSATHSVSEIRPRDRLLAREQPSVEATFYPHAPQNSIDGLVLNIEGGMHRAGALDVVAINCGDRDGLQVGHTLAVYRSGALVDDRNASGRIRRPDRQIGLLIVFYVYEKMSFALVMQADRQLDIGDMVRNP
jgi:hypothetical protein